jgi:hypothetical protein
MLRVDLEPDAGHRRRLLIPSFMTSLESALTCCSDRRVRRKMPNSVPPNMIAKAIKEIAIGLMSHFLS